MAKGKNTTGANDQLLEQVGQQAASLGAGVDTEALLTGAALCHAAAWAAAPVSADHWQAAMTRIVHAIAVARCFDPGDGNVAANYMLVLAVMAADHTFDFIIRSDKLLCSHAAKSAETTQDETPCCILQHSPAHPPETARGYNLPKSAENVDLASPASVSAVRGLAGLSRFHLVHRLGRRWDGATRTLRRLTTAGRAARLRPKAQCVPSPSSSGYG